MIDGNWVFQTSIRMQDAWKAERVFLALALILNAVGECQGTEAAEEVSDEEGGVPWKQWNAVQMLWC